MSEIYPEYRIAVSCVKEQDDRLRYELELHMPNSKIVTVDIEPNLIRRIFMDIIEKTVFDR